MIDIYRENRPWGSFERFTKGTPSTVKLITVKKGESLSLQYHLHREEFWRIIKGSPAINIDGKETIGKPGEDFFIEKEMQHQISAPTDDVLFLEIALGFFDENDIVRLNDKYGRTS